MSEILKANVPASGNEAESPAVSTDGDGFARFLLSMPKCGLPEGLPTIPRQNYLTPVKFGAISKDMEIPLFNPWPPSEEKP